MALNRIIEEGFARRMSEPLSFIPVYLTSEQEKALDKKYGPMLTRKERMQQFILRTSVPYGRKVRPYELKYKDDPPPILKDYV